jgi:phosphoglycolate phosphatase
VLLDWDNTLVDSWAVIHEALNHMFTALGRPGWTLDETRIRVRQSLRDAFPPLFGDRWEEARQLYLDRFEAIHLERLRALDGAERLLGRLQKRGIWLGVVSNKTGRLLRREVEALGWTGYFGRIVGAGDAAFDKPHRAPIDLALEGAGIVAGPEVWYVGDTGIDIECAETAGCVPVLVHVSDATRNHEADAVTRARHAFDGLDSLQLALDRCAPHTAGATIADS